MSSPPPVPPRQNRPPLPPSRENRPPLPPSRDGRPPLASRPPNKPLPLTPPEQRALAEKEAMKELELQRQQNLQRMFFGAKVKFGPKSAASATKDFALSAASLGNTIRGANTAKSTLGGKATFELAKGGFQRVDKNMVKEMFTTLFGGHSFEEIKEALPALELTKVVTDVVPIISQVTSGVKIVTSLAAMGKSIHANRKVKKNMHAVMPGDPRLAAEAVRNLLAREAAEKASEAAINGAKFGTSMASLTADGGVAASVAFGMISLAKLAVAIGIDITEMKFANKQLQTGPLDASLFTTCPLLGCYLIVNSNTSDIVHFLTGGMGDPGWMDDVERMRKDLDPVIDAARKFILASRLSMVGLPMDMAKKERNVVMRKYLDSKFRRQNKLNDRLKGRIQGFGSDS